MNIVFVESATKIKLIQSILNNHFKSISFKVFATSGHLDNLVKKTLGIDVQNQFKPQYEIIPSRKKWIQDIKKLSFQKIWIATDFDFEGEKIADSIIQIFKLKNFNRVYFNEITSFAIIQAFENPQTILNPNYLDCQLTRRIIDRLLGYKLTPFLWKLNQPQLSIGRVQGATLLLLEERENKIKEFKESISFQMYSLYHLTTNDHEIKCYLYENDQKLILNLDLNFLKQIQKSFQILFLDLKEEYQYPPKLFITSTLQQTAFEKLHFNVKKTMLIAQELYEKGKITYPRTDSYNISKTFLHLIQTYIHKKYPNYYFYKPIQNSSNAQLAHEAIRPSKLDWNACQDLSLDCQSLYHLIFKRTICFYLHPIIYEILPCQFIHEGLKSNQYFLYSIKKIKHEGFLIFDQVSRDDYDWDQEKKWIQDVTIKSITLESNYDHPTKRFNESSLIKSLEENGIGRPATFQIIMDKLMNKHYIEFKNISNENKNGIDYFWDFDTIKEKNKKHVIVGQKNAIHLTENGHFILNFIKEYCLSLLNINFTKDLENKLDSILHHNLNKIDIISEFYQQLQSIIQSIPISSFPKKENSNSIVKYGKFGPYITSLNNKNISISCYLEMNKKSSREFNQSDYDFLIQFPLKHNQGEICYGQYGFYIKDSKQKLSLNQVLKILKQ